MVVFFEKLDLIQQFQININHRNIVTHLCFIMQQESLPVLSCFWLASKRFTAASCIFAKGVTTVLSNFVVLGGGVTINSGTPSTT